MEQNYQSLRRLDYKAPDFTALSTELSFELADEGTVVRGKTRYKRQCPDKSRPLVLNGEDLTLISLSLNGNACQYREQDDRLIIENVPDEFELSVVNSIDPVKNSALMGLYKSNGTFCTQCEPHGFRRITYFLDRPDVLVKFRVTIIAPRYGCGVLLSNGNLVESGWRDGRRYAVWEDPFPKPSYLFALVAGTFDVVRDRFVTRSGRPVSLELYVDRGACQRGLWAMESIKTAMKWDEERFNLEYDLDNFKVVAVDFFNQGAMENKSLNIFNSIYVMVDPETATDTAFYNVQSVIGHEYFHNYTGDRVTLRDWFQLSLKESLTVFRDQEFSSDVASRTLTRLKAINVIRGAQFAEDAGPMAHPVRPDEVMEMNNFYTVTIYDKGAEIIRMIHTLIGEGAFQRGLAAYLREFDGQAVTIEDFLKCMEKAGGTDLSRFRRWYTQAGTPTVKASWSYETDPGILRLTLSQSTPPTRGQSEKQPFYIPVRLSFLDKSGRNVRPADFDGDFVILSEASQEYSFKLDHECLPVLLRDFSAPVRLQAPYSADDYSRMLSCCDDPFIKVDSSVQLQNRYARAGLKQKELPEPAELIEVHRQLLSSLTPDSDPHLVNEALRVQSLSDFMEVFEQIDLDALARIRDRLISSLAASNLELYEDLYHKIKAPSPKYSVRSMALRSLNNTAFRMLARGLKVKGKAAESAALVRTHYGRARNMTDRLSALTAAVHLNLGCREELLADFEKKYSSDPLVFDNYFRVQATCPDIDAVFTVRELLSHSRYDSSNPNRVRALPGALALSNPLALHRPDGEGYKLLGEVVAALNERNPQIAARILTPLLSFRRFDAGRQVRMLECLRGLRELPRLSRSLYEKLSAALERR